MRFHLIALLATAASTLLTGCGKEAATASPGSKGKGTKNEVTGSASDEASGSGTGTASASGSGTGSSSTTAPGQASAVPPTLTSDLLPDLGELDTGGAVVELPAAIRDAFAKDRTSVTLARAAGTLPFSADYLRIESAATSGRRLEALLGPSGQIVTLADGQLGSVIPEWPFTTFGGEYVDWVMQGVFVYSKETFVDPASGGTKPVILQQAGSVYSKPGGASYGPTTAPTFSPRLAESLGTTTHEVLVWPQVDQPNLVDLVSRPGGVLLQQTIEPLGAQVLAVTHVTYNVGERTLDRLSQPWIVVATGPLPTLIHGEGAGYKQVDVSGPGGSLGVIAADAPWVGFLDATGTRGLGIIYGKDSGVTHADGAAAAVSPDVLSVNNTGQSAVSMEAVRNVEVRPGEAIVTRFFLVLDFRTNLVARAAELLPYATQGMLRGPKESKLKAICGTSDDLGDCPEGATPRFYVLATFVPGARPLMKLRDVPTNKVHVTDDLYAIEPLTYKGKTRLEGLLGWAPVEAMPMGCAEALEVGDVVPTEELRQRAATAKMYVYTLPKGCVL